MDHLADNWTGCCNRAPNAPRRGSGGNALRRKQAWRQAVAVMASGLLFILRCGVAGAVEDSSRLEIVSPTGYIRSQPCPPPPCVGCQPCPPGMAAPHAPMPGAPSAPPSEVATPSPAEAMPAMPSAQELGESPFASALGASPSGGTAAPTMIGDFSGPLFAATLPSITGPGGTGPLPGLTNPFLTRTFKTVENQSAVPQNRVFYRFAYFNRVEQRQNHIYRQTIGFEKTVFDGRASIGMQLPIFIVDPASIPGGGPNNPIAVGDSLSGMGGSLSTAQQGDVGDLSIIMKYALLQSRRGDTFTAGLSVTAPTGPDTIANINPLIVLINPNSPVGVFNQNDQFIRHRGTLQPFLAFYTYLDEDARWFLHGFSAVDCPIDSRDVTLLFNDFGIGYYGIVNGRYIRALIPTFEVHVNDPVAKKRIGVALDSSNGIYQVDSSTPGGAQTVLRYPDQVNLTSGITALSYRRSAITFGAVVPVTGPNPYNYELQLQYNQFFGRPPRGGRPVFGGAFF
jgi:hypothetical protein